MEYLQFSLFTEQDFDEIIYKAGGIKYQDKYEVKKGEKNCDYILDEAVIELKFIDVNPTENKADKKLKQKKLAKLFPSKAKTIVLYPSDENKYMYYQILSKPIQNQLKKASKQLQESAIKVDAKIKIAIIMNNGLTMTSPDEFRKMAIEQTKNNTSGIDILIVCGMYYFSDKFKMITNFEFKDIQINEIKNYKFIEKLASLFFYKTKKYKTKQIIDKLRISWNSKIEEYMTSQIVDIKMKRKKEPIQDLFFELNGIRYVKPPIQWGESSEFYPKGRLREDSSNIDTCNPVSYILPVFNNESYIYAKRNLLENEILKESLEEYIQWAKNEQLSFSDIFQPISLIEVSKYELKNLEMPLSINKIQKAANLNFENKFKKIKDNCVEYSEEIISKNFIFVEIKEIGIDQANDIAFISHIKSEDNTNLKQNFLIYGERMKYECAILLALSYCIAKNAEIVCYHRNEDFKWK